jgi:hypothetical protein
MSLNELSDLYFELIQNIIFCESAADAFAAYGASIDTHKPSFLSKVSQKTLSQTGYKSQNEQSYYNVDKVEQFFIRAFTIIFNLGKNYIKKVEELSKTLKDIPISEITAINATIKANLIKKIDKEIIEPRTVHIVGITASATRGHYSINKDLFYKRFRIDEQVTDMVSLYNSVVTLFETINELGYRINASLTVGVFAAIHKAMNNKSDYDRFMNVLNIGMRFKVGDPPPSAHIKNTYFNYFAQLPSPNNQYKGPQIRMSQESAKREKMPTIYGQPRFFENALSLKTPLDFIKNKSINDMCQNAIDISTEYKEKITNFLTKKEKDEDKGISDISDDDDEEVVYKGTNFDTKKGGRIKIKKRKINSTKRKIKTTKRKINSTKRKIKTTKRKINLTKRTQYKP